MDLKLTAAIILGKLIAFILNVSGSGATAAPGLYALKIDKDLVRKISQKSKLKSVIISGTNGKTTASRLTSDILNSKFKIIHNRQGSNLLRGIASTLISKSSVSGKVDAELAIWEVDEATVPEAVKNTNPQILLLLNLFRDQLDRYGEVDTIRDKWQKTVSSLGKKTTLILNADDPGVSFLEKFHNAKTIFFGIEDTKVNLPETSNVADIRHCLNCGSALNYTTLLFAHIGHYFCTNCKLKRPKPQISAKNLIFNSDFSSKISLTTSHEPLTINYNLPGLYNVYNILASASIAKKLDIDVKQTKKSIENFTSAFGRFQKVNIGNKQIIVFLIKNPTGTNEVLGTIAQRSSINLLTILNDNIADGKDVSWIWDTDWEALAPKIKNITISGLRAWDLANRLKYAGANLSKKDVYQNIFYSIQKSLDILDKNDTLLILPTYTAMLEVQKALNELGDSSKWHKQ